MHGGIRILGRPRQQLFRVWGLGFSYAGVSPECRIIKWKRNWEMICTLGFIEIFRVLGLRLRVQSSGLGV